MKSFLTIDDDSIHADLCAFYVRKTNPGVDIIHFSDAAKALRYLESASPHPGQGIMLVNVNMPGMSGWDFLDSYERLDAVIRTRFTVYVVSASVHPADKQRAMAYTSVSDYLVKPIAPERIRQILA